MDSGTIGRRLRDNENAESEVVLICPEGAFRLQLTGILTQAQLCVTHFASDAAARAALPDLRPDLLIVDLSVLGGRGVAALHQFGTEGGLPVIGIGDRNDESEEIACLRAGAVDYIRTPVGARLLVERVRSQLRCRGVGFVAEAPVAGTERTLNCGALNMDARRHSVTWQGRPVDLTQTEFALLQALARRPGHVKTREQLLDVAWRDQDGVEDRTIDSHIKRLRKKIRGVDPEFSAIETLYGIGYRYSAPPGP